MLQNAYFLAKIGADTAENEQHFADILPTDARAGRGRGEGERGSAGTGGHARLPRPTSARRWLAAPATAARLPRGRLVTIEKR